MKYSPQSSSEDLFQQFKKIQGLLEKTQCLGLKAKDDPCLLASGAEFILEGLYALKRISRNEELESGARTDVIELVTHYTT